jgi:hypothetical protein
VSEASERRPVADSQTCDTLSRVNVLRDVEGPNFVTDGFPFALRQRSGRVIRSDIHVRADRVHTGYSWGGVTQRRVRWTAWPGVTPATVKMPILVAHALSACLAIAFAPAYAASACAGLPAFLGTGVRTSTTVLLYIRQN